MAKVLIATYSLSGRTAGVAKQLSQLIDGSDSYTISVAPGTFPQDMWQADAIATRQIKNNDYPALMTAVPDVSQYDLILVGSPVWRGAPATPVHTFLEQIQDFTGKVASFYTDAGAPGDYEKTFKKWAGKLNVLQGHEGAANLAEWIQTLK